MVLPWKFKNKNRIELLDLILRIEKKIHIRKKQNVACGDLKEKNGDWTKKKMKKVNAMVKKCLI